MRWCQKISGHQGKEVISYFMVSPSL
jgi:hypothetical protein